MRIQMPFTYKTKTNILMIDKYNFFRLAQMKLNFYLIFSQYLTFVVILKWHLSR